MYSQWLSDFYKKKLNAKSFKVLQHDHGPTYNDGGGWNDTIVEADGNIYRIYMASDYQCDNLKITAMKKVMKEAYEPI